MQFSLEHRTATLSVGKFSEFALGPHESGSGPQGLWRAQLGQHWHHELRARTEREFTVEGVLRPDVQFEIPVEGRLVHRGWTFTLAGRIDQLLPDGGAESQRVPPPRPTGSPDPAPLGGVGNPPLQNGSGVLLREIKSVMRPLPAAEPELRAAYPGYFLQLAAYTVLLRRSTLNAQLSTLDLAALRSELVFVEASSGLSQVVALTPFDEALVHHQLDALAEFLDLQLRASQRRRALRFQSPFPSLRPGQESIQADLAAACERSRTVLFEAPTGYGKTGCVLEFALGQLRADRFDRLIWLTGKSTGQLQVVRTLQQMTARPGISNPLNDKYPVTGGAPPGPDRAPGGPLAVWQVRNKGEHCVNRVFHCVRDACGYLAGSEERWPQSGLARFYLDEQQPRDLDTLRHAGRAARICPYEITRAALAFNDVWIGDYNYVFAPDNRGLFLEQPGFAPGRTLLVIDEAHNLPSRVADAHSHAARAEDARALLAELDHQRAPAALMLAAEEWTRRLALLQPADSLEPVLEAEIHDSVVKLAALVAAQPLDYAALGPRHSESLWQFAALAGFLDDSTLTKLLWVPRAGELSFTCLDAAAWIGETLRAYGGAILMSATLQPYEELAHSCGLAGRVVPDEPRLSDAPGASRWSKRLAGAPPPAIARTVRPGYATLRAPAPWRDRAYDVAVDLRVDTSFKQRAGHYGTTAAAIEAMHAAACSQPSVPDPPLAAARSIAVFFPSYAYAESVRRVLENSGSICRVSLQPRGTDLATQAAWAEESLALVDVLFLVLGSSFAEGIDLLGGRVTHAMVVGPALPEVNAIQKARLAAFPDLGRDAAFRRVYQIPGLQKVNQALGRLVRAPGQRAKVLLHCRRFADIGYASLLAPEYQQYREITNEAGLREWLGVPS